MHVTDLPQGAAPPPVPFPHFPDRLHAYVWRNWMLVPTARLAEVVGAPEEALRQRGQAMGLPAPPEISVDQQRRSYLTVIRRNWHLLPYEQLLRLLGWTAEEMAFTLREDDFLYVKLGHLKPACQPLSYVPPDAGARAREAEIARIVREAFPASASLSHDPLFSFVEHLSRGDGCRGSGVGGRTTDQRPTTNDRRPGISPLPDPRPPTPDTRLTPRFCYSYFALYGDPLLDTEADPYPEGYLARLAEAGVDGVWLQAILYKLAPFPWVPALSEHYARRLENLGSLVARTKQYGIGVYLYLNEPRAMPTAFYDSHPELQGVTEGDYAVLCTSAPAVQEYLTGAIASVCRAVPDLAGFFTITASENLTNCWSHGRGADCPRCGSRGPAEVIAEVNARIGQGIQEAGTGAELIAWDWGWKNEWAEEAIRRLPEGVALMSVSEWDLPIVRGGVEGKVGEYSISAVGPGPRAQRHWALARERGLKTFAKIQASNSWELSTVPYLPVLENVAQHVLNLCDAQVDGLMLGWTLGGYPSPNLEVAARAGCRGESRVESRESRVGTLPAVPVVGRSSVVGRRSSVVRHPTPDTLLESVAQRRFGPELASKAVEVWRACSAAFREFPFHIGVAYHAPTQLGPANLLWEEPTGYRGTMVGFPYDDLDLWCGEYPPEIFITQFEKVADGFEEALGVGRDSAKRKDGGALGTRRPTTDDRRQKQRSGGEGGVEEREETVQPSTLNPPPSLRFAESPSTLDTQSSVLSPQSSLFEEELALVETCAIHFRSVANQARFVLARRALAAAETVQEAGAQITELRRVLESEIVQAQRLHALQSRDSRLGFEASNQYAYVPLDLVEKVLNCRDMLDRWLYPAS